MTERDYIGPDPVTWLYRLRTVNQDSQFTAPQRKIIEAGLIEILQALGDREVQKR
jgi:hypothetical protein